MLDVWPDTGSNQTFTKGNDSKMRQKQLVSYLILIYLLFDHNNKTLLLEK